MELNAVCWNVKGLPRRLRDGQLALIEEMAPDVLLLQELTPDSFRMLEDRGWSGVAALQLLPRGHRGRAKGKEVKFSCAVLTRDRWRMSGVETNLEVPSPERWLAARLECDGVAVDVASFACPPGVVWGDMKVEQGRRIAAWMTCRTGPAIVGIDRNGPKYERADGSVELWPRDAPQLLGANPAHSLRDVLLDVFESDPTAERPGGPLEISYIRGNPGQRQTPCRYDVVYVSDDFRVLDVRYLYDESIAAGSDHAAVAVKLELNTCASPRRY